jgi:hypothetical protein
MNRFEQVLHILDSAVSGPSAPVGFHGAFWRGLTRNQFVARFVAPDCGNILQVSQFHSRVFSVSTNLGNTRFRHLTGA